MSDAIVVSRNIPEALDNIDSRLAFIEALQCQTLRQLSTLHNLKGIEIVKSYHWVTVVVVLVVAYLVGVKYPSVGQSALSKVGL